MGNRTCSRNLALIGAGYWGRNLARSFRALGALRSICDVDRAVLATYDAEYLGVKKTTSAEKVLDDPTITQIAIAAPAVAHYELARAGLEAGKDVFVEKPLCLQVAEAEELVCLAERKGRVLMVSHLLQYHPCVQQLHALLAQGELGKLQYIILNRLNLGRIRQDENVLWSFAPQDLSVILSLAGNELPEQIRCVGGSYLNDGVADTTLIALRFAGGLRGHVFVSWLNPFKEQKLTVVGSNGMIVFDEMRTWEEKLILHRKHLTWTHGRIPTPNWNSGVSFVVPELEPLREACAHFLSCCEQRGRPRTDGREGWRVLKVLQMAQASLDRDGEAVSLAKGERDFRSFTSEYRPSDAHPSLSSIGQPSSMLEP